MESRLSKRSAPVAGIACQRLHWVRWKPQALRRFADDLVPDDLLPPVFSRKKTTSSENGLSVRRIVWLALTRPERLTREQAQEVIRASFLHPEVAIALTLAQAFVKMVRERNVEALPAWLAEVQASSIREFHQFARGLERDRAAIETALSRKAKQWSG